MAESVPTISGEAVRQAQPSCVLVVDDNVATADALARLLEDQGWQTVVCYNGLDALKQMECVDPAAAVVDIHLPDISGLILTTKLRERFGPKMPIIVLSGDTSMENIRSLPHAGASYFISKPFNSEHLIEQLKELAAQ